MVSDYERQPGASERDRPCSLERSWLPGITKPPVAGACYYISVYSGTGDVALTVFQSLPVEGVVIVSSPQILFGGRAHGRNDACTCAWFD